MHATGAVKKQYSPQAHELSFQIYNDSSFLSSLFNIHMVNKTSSQKLVFICKSSINSLMQMRQPVGAEKAEQKRKQ